MGHRIFAFSLATDAALEKGQAVFSEGEPIGRVLTVHKLSFDDAVYKYDYDVESTPDIYAKLKSGEMKLYRMDRYNVSPCSIHYTRD